MKKETPASDTRRGSAWPARLAMAAYVLWLAALAALAAAHRWVP